MSPTAGTTHDITIEDTAGTNKKGFMLYHGQDKRRPHRISDARTISPRSISSAASLRNSTNLGEFSLNYRQYWSQSDWRGGVGGILARLHPTRLTGGYRMDVTSDGRLVAPRDLLLTTVDTAPDEAYVTGFAVQGAEVWSFIGRDVYRWDYTNKDWDIGTEPVAAANKYRNGVEYGGRTIVPSWTQAADAPVRYIYKSAAGLVWTRIDSGGSDTTSNSPKYLAVANDVLWGGYWLNTTNQHMVRSTSDPTASANWTSLTAVGTSDSEITNLLSDGDVLLVCKTNGVWALYKDGTTRNLTPAFETMRHPDHFRASFVWNGHALLSMGWGGLRDLWEGRLYDISFQHTLPGFPQLWGKIVAISGDADQVYVLVQNSGLAGSANDLYLLRGIFVGFEDGSPAWRWYPQSVLTMGGTANGYTATLFAEGIPSGTNIHRRCWHGFGQIAAGTNTARPRFLPQDEDVEDAYYTGSFVSMFSTIFDANTPGIDKIFLDLVFNTRKVTSTRTIYVVYRTNARPEAPLETADTMWTSIGTMTTDDATLTLPAGVTGKNIQFAFRLTAEAANTPEIIEYTLRYYLRPPRSETLPLRLYLADGQMLLNGTVGGSPKGDLSQLRTWAGTVREVKLVDAEKNTQTVIFIPGSLTVTELTKEPGRRSEYLVELLAAEV